MQKTGVHFLRRRANILDLLNGEFDTRLIPEGQLSSGKARVVVVTPGKRTKAGANVATQCQTKVARYKDGKPVQVAQL